MIKIETNRFSGYSFTNSCYATSEKEVANDLYDALTQFFQLFNTLKNNDFYVTGESYAGKYVPAISYKIHTSNKLMLKSARPRDVINLKVSTIFLVQLYSCCNEISLPYPFTYVYYIK